MDHGEIPPCVEGFHFVPCGFGLLHEGHQIPDFKSGVLIGKGHFGEEPPPALGVAGIAVGFPGRSGSGLRFLEQFREWPFPLRAPVDPVEKRIVSGKRVRPGLGNQPVLQGQRFGPETKELLFPYQKTQQLSPIQAARHPGPGEVRLQSPHPGHRFDVPPGEGKQFALIPGGAQEDVQQVPTDPGRQRRAGLPITPRLLTHTATDGLPRFGLPLRGEAEAAFADEVFGGQS